MSEHYYFVGEMRDPPESRPMWGGNLVLVRAEDNAIALVAGPGPYDDNSVSSAASWLERRPFLRWFYAEKVAGGIEPPGWFERECSAGGFGWFVPIAKRIAAGEKVSLEEITTTYAAHNRGRAMPHGTVSQLFEALGRPPKTE
jgi:hypothetical protein